MYAVECRRFTNHHPSVVTGSHAHVSPRSSCSPQYHSGYRRQVATWPNNPLDAILREVRRRFRSAPATVADFGCGDARLAQTLCRAPDGTVALAPDGSGAASGGGFTVFSYDLHAPHDKPYVTVANSANVPLRSASVDAAVFCLSLMGTDYAACLAEAARVLRVGGALLVAEVRSRFDSAADGNGGDATRKRRRVDAAGEQNGWADGSDDGSHGEDGESGPRGSSGNGGSSALESFVQLVEALGFSVEQRDERNTMFVLLYFKRTRAPAGRAPLVSARPVAGALHTSQRHDTDVSSRPAGHHGSPSTLRQQPSQRQQQQQRERPQRPDDTVASGRGRADARMRHGRGRGAAHSYTPGSHIGDGPSRGAIDRRPHVVSESGASATGAPPVLLRPCVYKRR